MVFEKFVVQLLDTYLKDYIENLDYKKLNIDLWNGNVTLENLSLKSNALADLNLPILIKFGYLHKLLLQIPWKNLYTQPTKVTIDGLYLIIMPKLEVEYDPEQDELDQYKSKMKKIEKIEKLRNEGISDEMKDDSDTFGARMKLQIIQNLELSIHNVHIIYEDRTTKPQHPFAFGVTLSSMTFQTTNKDWIPTVLQEKTPMHYKFGELNSLAIYWNSNAKFNSNEILKNLQAKIAVDNQHIPSDMSYIFRPLNIKAKLILTLQPRQLNFTKPMFYITIDLDHISLNLNRSQYLDILDLLEYQEYTINKLKYQKYEVKSRNARWKFAYNAIVNEIIRPRLERYEWQTIRKHRHAWREYRSIYYQGLCEKITDEQKQRAEELEKQLDEFNLLFIRQYVQLEVKKKKEQEPKSLFQNLANWWKKKPKETSRSEFDFNKIMSDEEKQNFYETIGYKDDDISTSTYPKEYVDIDATIQLNLLDLNLWSRINEQNLQLLTQINLSNAEFIFRRRPATSSNLFYLNLTSFHVLGCSSETDQTRPILIQPILLNDTKLLQTEFLINPTENDSGYRLQLLSQSLEIKYHSTTINKLMEYFRKASQQNLQRIKQVAYTKYTDIKNQSIIMIKSNVNKIKNFDIHIDLQSSYILLPQNGIYIENCPIICIDMGHFIFRNINSKNNYTQFQLELKHFQLLYSSQNDNWQLARRDKTSRLHLIQPITLYTDLYKCIESDNKQYPIWKISGQIADINMRISDMRLIQMIKHIQSITSTLITIDEDEDESWKEETLEISDMFIENEEFTQLETNFEIFKIDLYLEEEKLVQQISPFIHLSLISIRFQSLMKTFDFECQISLNNFTIFHQQSNQYVRLLSSFEDDRNSKLVSIDFLHTSSNNPRYLSLKYNQIANHLRIHLNKFLFELKLEIVLSIEKFHENFMIKWSKEFIEYEEKKAIMIETEKSFEKITIKIQADLQEFCLIISTIQTQLFDVHIQGIKGEINRRKNQTNMNLILKNFCLFDSNNNMKYRKIICQQNGENDFLSVSILLFSYSPKFVRSLDDLDCSIQINFAKANIIFLYKHVDQLMTFLELLNLSKLAADQADRVYEKLQKLQNQTFKLGFNAVFHAPNIIIPINSTSNEGLVLDLGQIHIQTKFLEHPKRSLIEQQDIRIENVRASRIENNLFNCSQSTIVIHRLLYQDIKVDDQPYISIDMHWGSIEFQLTRDDYLCVLRILMENFNDQTKMNITKEKEVLKKIVSEDVVVENIKEKLKIRSDFEKLSLTLYFDRSNSKLANVEFDFLEIIYRQFTNEDYKLLGRIKDFHFDDLRESHQKDAVIHLIDRHSTVQPDAFMLIAGLDCKSNVQRRIDIQLESLAICIKIDYLLILYEFFLLNLPNENKQQTISHSKDSNDTIETHLNLLMKNPEIILLENQDNFNSNCLVLNFALMIRLVNIETNTNLISEINDLTIYSSNFQELKIKYRILQPIKLKLAIINNTAEQKIDMNTSNIFVNISPAIVRLVMNVLNTLDYHQKTINEEIFDIETMFECKTLNEDQFGFLKNEEKESILSIEQKETNVSQQLFLNFPTIEIKFDIDFELDTKSVVAMCLSDITFNIRNWSTQLILSSNLNLEAALYNQHTIAWEPFIEPIPARNQSKLSPWNLTCSIKTIELNLLPTQLISIQTDQLLNLTITKTGLQLLKDLSSLFTDYNRLFILKSIDNKNKSMLELINSTGDNIFINYLQGLKFTDDSTWTSMILEVNQSIALTSLIDRTSYRLSVIEQQTSNNQQEFSLQIKDSITQININHTCQRIYNLQTSSPMEILVDTQIKHNQRRIHLCSIVKLINHTLLPIILFDLDSITEKNFHRIDKNEEFHVPIDLLYKNSNSTLLIGLDNNTQTDFILFDWLKSEICEETLQLSNDQIIHLILYKEIHQACFENTKQLTKNSYSIHIYSPIELTNLLPIDLQCLLNESETILLESNKTQLITSGNNRSVMNFLIPWYDQYEWKSDRFDLRSKKNKNPNERTIHFRNGEETFRIMLHMDIVHQSYRLLLYTPFWIINHTYLKLQFRIANEQFFIPNNERTVLVCPKNYSNDKNKTGEISLSNHHWSDKFSLDVIQNIGMTNCKGSNDKTHMICVDIRTSSFGLTKIITLLPAMVIINQTSILLEVVESIEGKEQDQWKKIKSRNIIPFWPVNAKESLMSVRYAHNRIQSKFFYFNKKHRTLLYLNDRTRPVISVEVIATEFDGIQMIFSDYKIGDAPVLIINQTKNQLISFVQKDEKEIQYLMPEQFVYYTWTNPIKPRELSIASEGKPSIIELNPCIAILDTSNHENLIPYAIFIDGVQMILLFSNDYHLIERIFSISSIDHRCLRIRFPKIGLSIINDQTHEELIYFSLKNSKIRWTEMNQFRIRLFPNNLQKHLEEFYQKFRRTNQMTYSLHEYPKIIFHEHRTELINQKGKRIFAKRQTLPGLWFEYTWSTTTASYYVRINHLQIDNQLNYTIYPCMLYPKRIHMDADEIERAFIEMSIHEKNLGQSKIRHFQYCKVLVQEFVFRIDQDLIISFLNFFKQEEKIMPININDDLEYIQNSFQRKLDISIGENQIFFEKIHLSPLKIHVSLTLSGKKSTEDLFGQYPFVGVLLQTLNIVEVQDIVLRLCFYEKKFYQHTQTKFIEEILSHYQNQLFKQIHVLILSLDILGNPLGIIRGFTEGLESLFYEPIQGAIEGPIEFVEGLGNGVISFVESTVGTTAGALSKITGAIGVNLARLSFDEKYQNERIRRKGESTDPGTDMAIAGKNAVMGFVHGVAGVVKEPFDGAKHEGAAGLFKGIGKGLVGVVAKPASGIVDLASTSLDVVKRAATHEQIIRRIRYPRYISSDGLIRPYIPHEAMGLYILNRLGEGKYAKTDSYIAHIICSKDPFCWLMATSHRIICIEELSIFDKYQIQWTINYSDLQEIPSIQTDTYTIQILTKSKTKQSRSVGKLVEYLDINDARYFIEKMITAMNSLGLK